jgi:hypothetical protein
MIAGAEVYAGGNLAMVVWGDDPTTKEVDGLQTGEQWELRIWKNSSGAEAGFSGISWPSRSGTYETDAIIVADRVQTDVRETVAPDGIVAQNYPNPFNLSTTIQFSLPKAGHVHVQVFNTLGEMILPILDDDLEEGLHTIQCNGSSLASGLYYYKIECGSFVAIRKMVLAK